MKKIGDYKLVVLIMFSAVLMGISTFPDANLESVGISLNEQMVLAGDDIPLKDDEYPPIVIPNGMDSTHWQIEQPMDSVMYLDDNIPPHIFIPLLNI